MDINYKDLYCELSIDYNKQTKKHLSEIDNYKNIIVELENKIKDLEIRLKKYTAPERNKKAYEKRKLKILEEKENNKKD